MTIFGRDRVARLVVVGFGATVIGHRPDRSPSELGLEALDEALEVWIRRTGRYGGGRIRTYVG